MANKAIAYRRLFNQRIAGAKSATPEEAIRRLGAMQAQDDLQAIWAIGCRTEGAQAADIEQALVDKKIVLTWAMRGTLHFVPAEDVKWMLKLAPRMLAQNKRRLEQLEIDAKLLVHSESLIRSAMQDKGRISRPDLMQLLESAGIGTKNQRGYQLLWFGAVGADLSRADGREAANVHPAGRMGAGGAGVVPGGVSGRTCQTLFFRPRTCNAS
nr:crosslink repair DNA glycosylase YcaQ family protein [Cohnella thermotolerans]